MSEISKTKLSVLSMIDSFKNMVINDCDDETIMLKIHDLQILDNGTFREEDYLTYDEAIKELGINYNRNRLSDLAKKHGIRNRKFNSTHVGFHRDDIRKLKLLLQKEND